MKWYDKFKVGQKVKVVEKTQRWVYRGHGMGWNDIMMDRTIGKVYTIVGINKRNGYKLGTQSELGFDYWYPLESLAGFKGEQLLFAFML